MRALHCSWLLALCLCGCQNPGEPASRPQADSAASEATPPTDLKQHVRNNSASLLYDLLKDESNLSKLLLVKRESKELNELVHSISAAANRGVKQLEQLVRSDRTLDLHAMGLPSGEAAARDAESKTKEHELLHAKGADFEFALLLTQAEALSYGAHLAKVASENETQPEAARQLSALSGELKGLYEQVVSRLRK